MYQRRNDCEEVISALRSPVNNNATNRVLICGEYIHGEMRELLIISNLKVPKN